ncbi:hypothetical protein [Streptomyces monomycini]|uniref:hypothetical protein n=1 Tax=Streptomyces monomycini TaxID=371720 RepID=UPI0004AAE137|nr:hypothetical protein [Streptomyces monomycini]
MNDQNNAQPTSAAYVTFSTTPEGPSIALGVPAEQSGLLMRSVSAATGVAGSALGPYLMARALHLVKSDAPWQLQVALLVLAALLPLLYILLGRRS